MKKKRFTNAGITIIVLLLITTAFGLSKIHLK